VVAEAAPGAKPWVPEEGLSYDPWPGLRRTREIGNYLRLVLLKPAL